jgi:hypothetical protein
MSELTRSSKVVFRLRLDKDWFSYRAFPVGPGTLTKRRLRRAMNAMNRH